MYKISIQYTNLFKRYWTETICVTYETDRTDGTDVRTDSGDTICTPIENGEGGEHNKNIPPLALPATRIADLAQLCQYQLGVPVT